MTRVEHAEARTFAERWQSAWNSHDLDALLAHFSPDVVLSDRNGVCEILTFRDGLVVEGRAAYDTESAAAASGLPS
jgi:ketosteroid isomerase-like protein